MQTATDDKWIKNIFRGWVNYLRLFALECDARTDVVSIERLCMQINFAFAIVPPLDHQIYFISFNRKRMNHRNEWVICEIEVFHLRGKMCHEERFASCRLR